MDPNAKRSNRRIRLRAAALIDALEVGETWDVRGVERAFNFEKHWAQLVTEAPEPLKDELVHLRQEVVAKSPTFKRLVSS